MFAKGWMDFFVGKKKQMDWEIALLPVGHCRSVFNCFMLNEICGCIHPKMKDEYFVFKSIDGLTDWQTYSLIVTENLDVHWALFFVCCFRRRTTRSGGIIGSCWFFFVQAGIFGHVENALWLPYWQEEGKKKEFRRRKKKKTKVIHSSVKYKTISWKSDPSCSFYYTTELRFYMWSMGWK